ncbi:MAG TPA: ABC transporter ATP-binding protein [Alphaproteobacteria bacterium]|nr:ABC transporter ATP-binding protein [Alphaproteobacteria bacterium]
MPAISAEKLQKAYSSIWGKRVSPAQSASNGSQTNALTGLTLEVREGETFGFLGPNGAGKTTTILLLLNLIRPTSGSVELFGRPATDFAVHRRLGYLPESVNLHDYYTGRGLLEFYAGLLEVPISGRKARIADLLQLLRLEDAAEKRVSKYSKGMLQRLGFAQAMLHDPDLLILDEPTASLDPVGRKEFRDILLELKRRGKTIFISSHILSEVETVCDRVAILEKGELKKVGTLQELSSSTSTRLFLRNVPGTVLEALSKMPAEVTMISGHVTIKCADAGTRAAVEELLRQYNIQPDKSEVETQSLENIFFSSIAPPPKL